MLVARITDDVLWKSCGIYKIITGSGSLSEANFSAACVGDLTACDPKSKIITGSGKFNEGTKPLARIGDKVICKGCGIGKIITGSSSFDENG
jgi:uncharacterized Zn-binding protein involved in type VI secretion